MDMHLFDPNQHDRSVGMQRKEKNVGASTASKAFKTGQDRFMELINLLPQAVIEIQFDGTLLFANWHSRKLFGYSLDDNVIGKVNVFSTLSRRDRERIADSIGKMISGAKAKPPRLQRSARTEQPFPPLRMQTLSFTSGTPTGARVIVADISDKKEVEGLTRPWWTTLFKGLSLFRTDDLSSSMISLSVTPALREKISFRYPLTTCGR